jgi:hypothetical protein
MKPTRTLDLKALGRDRRVRALREALVKPVRAREATPAWARQFTATGNKPGGGKT